MSTGSSKAYSRKGRWAAVRYIFKKKGEEEQVLSNIKAIA